MNYGQLKGMVLAYAHRSQNPDPDLVSQLGNMFELARLRIGRDIRLLELERAAIVDAQNNAIGFPPDFVSLRAINASNTGGNIALDYVTPDQYTDLLAANGTASGTYFYTIANGQIQVGPGLGAVSITYYAYPKILVNDADMNQVTNKWPNLYLYGVLREVWTYLQDYEAMVQADGMYEREADLCNKQAQYARTSGAPLVMRAV